MKYYCNWINLVSGGEEGVVPGDYPTPDGLKYWRDYVYVAHSPDYVLWEEGKPLSDGLVELLEVGTMSGASQTLVLRTNQYLGGSSTIKAECMGKCYHV
jgi:hypothetical protein